VLCGRRGGGGEDASEADVYDDICVCAGFVRMADWCAAMTSVLKMELPWRNLRPHLASANANGFVEYNSTFLNVRIETKMTGETVSGFALIIFTDRISYKHKYFNQVAAIFLCRLPRAHKTRQLSLKSSTDTRKTLKLSSGLLTLTTLVNNPNLTLTITPNPNPNHNS
jgi:hypothetical protein